MEFAIREGFQRFDAGAQGEHKLIRGFEPVITRSWHYLLHPGLRQAVEEFLVQEREGVLGYAEAARQALPYRQGYADRCASATGPERKDGARLSADMNYRTGWTDGRGLCRRRYNPAAVTRRDEL